MTPTQKKSATWPIKSAVALHIVVVLLYSLSCEKPSEPTTAIEKSSCVTPFYAQTTIVTYPAPPEEPLSDMYRMWVNNIEVAVYQQRTLDPPFAGHYDYGGRYGIAGDRIFQHSA